MRWFPAYVAVGSNLGDSRARVEEALARMARIESTRLEARSALYLTKPLGPRDQPDFVNAAAGLLTRLDAAGLLQALQAIEREMGRQPPPVRWGPRIIDLDLLIHGATVLSQPGLTLPHPSIHERNFVLYPLADVAPELHIPGHGSVAELAQACGHEGLRQLTPGSAR